MYYEWINLNQVDNMLFEIFNIDPSETDFLTLGRPMILKFDHRWRLRMWPLTKA